MQLGQMSFVGMVLLVIGFFTGNFLFCFLSGFIFSYTQKSLGDNVGFLKGFSYGAALCILVLWIIFGAIALLL